MSYAITFNCKCSIATGINFALIGFIKLNFIVEPKRLNGKVWCQTKLRITFNCQKLKKFNNFIINFRKDLILDEYKQNHEITKVIR